MGQRRFEPNPSRWNSPAGKKALAHLVEAFYRNGYWRSGPPEGARKRSHRGYECRFSALTAKERDAIVRSLRRLGVVPGRPFAKGSNWRVPVYGKEQVDYVGDAMRAAHAKRGPSRKR